MEPGPVFLIVALGLFLSFLVLLFVMGLAATRTVAPDGAKRRGFAGFLGMVFLLLFLCTLGAIGTGSFVFVAFAGTVVEQNPIESIEIHAPGSQPEELAPHGLSFYDEEPDRVHLRFTVRGQLGTELMELVRDVLHEEWDEFDDAVDVTRVSPAEGIEYAVYDFRLPITQRDLAELEREIEHELDGLEGQLPENVVIRFEGAERDH